MDTLDVLYGDQLVGKLWQTEKGRLIFQYVQKWVQSGFDISVSLPLQEQPFDADEARPFFANILPEESVRRRIAKKLGISEGNDYALLEAIGGECAGALTVIPEGKAPETISEQYKELSDVELNFLIRSLPQRPLLAGERGVRL